jgi:hypothetical protein
MATVIIVAATAPAYAQDLHPNLFTSGMHLKTDVEVKQEKEREQAYKYGISKIPNQKAKADPWGNVRAMPPQSSPQRPASR